jgi:hypothetical protein
LKTNTHLLALCIAVCMANAALVETGVGAPNNAKTKPQSAQSLLEELRREPCVALSTFNEPPGPTNVFDGRSLVRAIKKTGFKYSIIKAKGQDGFCNWDTKDYDFDLRSGSIKRDLIGEFMKECETEGITPGICYSVADKRYEGKYIYNGPLGVPYFNHVKKQIAQLLAMYPDTRMLMMFGDNRFSREQFLDLCQIVKKAAPNCLILGDRRDSGKHSTSGCIYGRKGIILREPAKMAADYKQNAIKGQVSYYWLIPQTASGDASPEQISAMMQLRSLAERKSSSQPETKANPAERLKQVKALFDQGLISKEDYDKKVKEIMDSL